MASVDFNPSLLSITGASKAAGEQGTQGVGRTQFNPPSDGGFFAGNLVGINTNIGVGEYQDAQEQCGRKLGGTTLAFA